MTNKTAALWSAATTAFLVIPPIAFGALSDPGQIVIAAVYSWSAGWMMGVFGVSLGRNV